MAHRLWSLLGFHLGVELAQCVVALVGVGVAFVGQARWPAMGPWRFHQLGLIAAVVVGTIAFIERLL